MVHRVVIFSNSNPCCMSLVTPEAPHVSCLFEIKKHPRQTCGAVTKTAMVELRVWAERIFSKQNSAIEVRNDECLQGILQLTGVFLMFSNISFPE